MIVLRTLESAESVAGFCNHAKFVKQLLLVFICAITLSRASSLFFETSLALSRFALYHICVLIFLLSVASSRGSCSNCCIPIPSLDLASPSMLMSSLLLTRSSSVFPQSVQLQFVRAMGYKLKTKAAVKKRFKVNYNGLVKRAQANKRHIATKKTRERIRRLGKSVFVQGQIRKNVLRMLGK